MEDRAVPALIVGPVVAVEDIPFNGKVARFVPGDVQGGLANFAATINRGDGTAAAGTVVQNNQGGFDVDSSAPKTFTQFGSFPVTVNVTGANNSFAFNQGTATVAGAPLTPNPIPTTFTATAGQAFNGIIGSFQDVNTASSPGSVSTGDGSEITINRGRLPRGSASQPGQSPV